MKCVFFTTFEKLLVSEGTSRFTLVGHITCSCTWLRILLSFEHHWVRTFPPFKPWTVKYQVFAYQTLGKVQDPSSLKCNIAYYSQNPLEETSYKMPVGVVQFLNQNFKFHEHAFPVCLAFR